ncbi:MAG: hypothetical protein RLW61_08720 [Gammaproteobacteria bacterium]
MSTPRIRLLLAAVLLCTSVLPAHAMIALAPAPTTLMLYDDSLGSLPEAQGALTYFDDGFLFGGNAMRSVVPTVGTAYTTDALVRGGWTSTGAGTPLPELDRQAGFRLDFELDIVGESHANGNRAGFSVILLGADGHGIELGFWDDAVWAQSGPGFTQAESAAFASGAGEIAWGLEVVGDGYTLFADGNALLGGAVRDYAPAGFAPYTLANYLFLGDNTTSAGADIRLGTVSLTAYAPVPLPGALGLLVAGCGGLAAAARRARGSA